MYEREDSFDNENVLGTFYKYCVESFADTFTN